MLGLWAPCSSWPHLEWCTACPGRSGGLWGVWLGEHAPSQQGLSQAACSSRAELMSLSIAGMARRRPCSAVVAHEACTYGQISIAVTCLDDRCLVRQVGEYFPYSARVPILLRSRSMCMWAKQWRSHLARWQWPNGDNFALHVSRHAAGSCSCQNCVALEPFRVVCSMRLPPVSAAPILLLCQSASG